MPTATKVNKSEEIRKLYSSGVTSASEIVSKLKTRGIKVVPAQVYQAMSKNKKKGKKKSSAAKSASSGASNGKHSVLDDAIVFVRSAGGMQSAKELLSKLSLLKN
jgi:hypothetical protein